MKGRITRASVRALTPAARDRFLWDTDLAGFGLKVTPAGKRIYVYQYRAGGRAEPTRRVTLGSEEDGLAAADARARATELAGIVRKENNGAPPTPGPRSNPSRSTETWQIRLGFLTADIARLQSALLRRTMKNLGASHAQWTMLGRLALHQGITQMELAQMLDLSKVAVTGLVDRAVRAGWVERRLDERDKRVRRLYLTRRAKAAVSDMRDKVDAMTAQSMRQISDAEGEKVVAVLDGIKRRLLPLARRDRQNATMDRT
ncbi:MAG TPA: MarR family transcriptional regulator [Rhizomicrobium sp.]|nr:MarR family transcriptional regulator [Rhizomicrobium sp.]